MDNKQQCQSCGKSISVALEDFGTNEDGTSSMEYCFFCFQNGEFMNPDQTLAEMIQSSVDNMKEELGIPTGQAKEVAKKLIPTLGRWKDQ